MKEAFHRCFSSFRFPEFVSLVLYKSFPVVISVIEVSAAFAMDGPRRLIFKSRKNILDETRVRRGVRLPIEVNTLVGFFLRKMGLVKFVSETVFH